MRPGELRKLIWHKRKIPQPPMGRYSNRKALVRRVLVDMMEHHRWSLSTRMQNVANGYKWNEEDAYPRP